MRTDGGHGRRTPARQQVSIWSVGGWPFTRDAGERWDRRGPYLAERQWATVREDYSSTGDAWGAFPHEHARSRAYRWGEDGLLGFSDDQARLCFALALWNGNDPILKERLLGLTGPEGNHGEDVKEAYNYLDATPTHSYLRALYRYPHRAFPYADLVAVSRARGRDEPEYELVDTGIFDGDRYFDVTVEYARAAPDDILVRLTAVNDIGRWLDGDPTGPPPPAERRHGRNAGWRHLNNADVISMPDSWEYPRYASWDLAFHGVAFARLDPDFAKRQLVLLPREWYMHPNGQVPAYEWAFDDVNPPVVAWAALRVYEVDARENGTPDRDFLERMFHKLMMSSTWWVNRKDHAGRNLFQGGFLGLDNIGVFLTVGLGRIVALSVGLLGAQAVDAAKAPAAEILDLARQTKGEGVLRIDLAARSKGVVEEPMTATVAGGSPPPVDTTVHGVRVKYAPNTLTVPVGTTVVWVNDEAPKHTVTADDGSFDSPTQATGETFSQTFSEPGTWLYYCRFHGDVGAVGISGTIVVG